MAARKGQAPKRQGQAAEPPPASAAENAAPPEQAAPAGDAPDPAVVTVGSAAAAAPDPAPPASIEETADADDLGLYPVLSPLRFDGRRYRPDDPDANEVVMPRGQAAPLQDIDVLGEELT